MYPIRFVVLPAFGVPIFACDLRIGIVIDCPGWTLLAALRIIRGRGGTVLDPTMQSVGPSPRTTATDDGGSGQRRATRADLTASRLKYNAITP